MRDPDLSCNAHAARAWKAAYPDDVRAKWPAGCDVWLLHLPGHHPAWTWYVISSCALRDMEGVEPAKKQAPNMTHEVHIIALDPQFVATDEWATDTENRWGKHWLRPENMCAQIPDFTDELCNELVRLFVQAFVHRQASPEQLPSVLDRLAQGTANHLREGRHVPN